MNKKLISIILIFSMILPMAACAKKDAAYVSNLIDSIGEVTKDSGKKIKKAEEAYQSLSDEEKKKVTNHIDLINIQTQYEAVSLEDDVAKLVAEEKYDEAIELMNTVKYTQSEVLVKTYNSIRASVTPKTMKGVESDVPFTWEFVENYNEYEVYQVKVDNDYDAEEDAFFNVIFGTGKDGNEVYIAREITPEDAKEGINIHIGLKDVYDLGKAGAGGVIRVEKYNDNAKAERLKKSNEIEIAKQEGKKTIPLPEKTYDGISYKDIAKGYGFDENLSYIVNPQNNDDYINNFIYSFMIGNWAYLSYMPSNVEWILNYDNGIISLGNVYHILGPYANSCESTVVFANNRFYIVTEGKQPYLSESEMYQQMITAYVESKKIVEDFHKRGYVTEGMSQYQIMEAYNKHLSAYFVERGYKARTDEEDLDFSVKADANRLYTVYDNGVYPLVVNNFGMCAAHASVFSMMMTLEGITSYTVHCEVETPEGLSGHMVSVQYIDGKEYFVDWFNKIGIYTIENAATKAHHIIDATTISIARKAAGYKQETNQKTSSETTKEKAERIAKSFGSEYLNRISSDYTRIALPEIAAQGVTYKELAWAYCKDENFSYIVNPKTDADHWNNVKYAVLTGTWDYVDIDLRRVDRSKYSWTAFVEAGPGYEQRAGQYLEAGLDAALLGDFSGGTFDMFFFYENGTYHMSLGNMEESKLPSPAEYKGFAVESYKVAKAEYDTLRNEGKITANSTEYEKAKAWSDWFCTVKIAVKEGREDSYIRNTGAAYGALVLKEGACGSRNAAFCLFMNMEGITAYGLVNGCIAKDGRKGHIAPWLLLDGKEYMFEYNSGEGLIPVDRESASALAKINSIHYFQKYTYNTILKRVGLPYDKGLESKGYMDEQGNDISREEALAIEKNLR